MSVFARTLRYFSMFCCFLCPLSFAQQYPNAGFPPFSTQTGSQYDQIDIADGNVSISLPVRTVNSGPLPLSFALFGASNAYIWDSPSNGITWAITTPNLSLIENVGASITVDSSVGSCDGNADTVYTNIAVKDMNGTIHPLSTSIVQDSGGCDSLPSPPAQQTTDGSGYTFVFTGFGVQGNLYDKFGNSTG